MDHVSLRHYLLGGALAALGFPLVPPGIAQDLVFAFAVGVFLYLLSRMHVAAQEAVLAQQDRLVDDLAYQATHDALTQLPNRAQALVMLEGSLSRARRAGVTVGLLFVDLDDFKTVNETYGQRAGDDVLQTVAQRLGEQIRGGDMIARLGADQFVVLLEPVAGLAAAVDVAERIAAAIAEPVTTGDGRELDVTVCIGVAVSEDGSIDAGRMLREADTAVQRAKTNGGGQVEAFDSSLRRELAERANLETAIGSAIENDEFVLNYHPIIDVRSGRVQGFESLVRWERPGLGLVFPADFVPAAEEMGLVCDLDTWVLRHATRQLVAWLGSGNGASHLSIAVNVSGRHISEPRIVDDVRAALQESGLPAAQLTLEINEAVLLDDPPSTQHLQELRKLGVAVSIDDFGTGYNSISRLQHLPVDVVKIDRSFLYGGRPSSNRLLQLIIQTAHAFGLPVVAEGVESYHQLETLKSMNCESAQGFYFAHPMNAADTEVYLAHAHVDNGQPVLNLPRLVASSGS